ncbi:hypothetical protein HY251_19960, partial [bacterium]|nr:hypothetical protein [bacterium]
MSSRHRIYGLTLTSELPLPELAPLEDERAPADVAVSLRDQESLGREEAWFSERTGEDGTPWLSCARTAAGFLCRFHGLADAVLDAAGRKITLSSSPETTDEALRHVLLDSVLPLVLNLRGREALHATAVRTPRGVCAFTGRAGAGKSTVAA